MPKRKTDRPLYLHLRPAPKGDDAGPFLPTHDKPKRKPKKRAVRTVGRS